MSTGSKNSGTFPPLLSLLPNLLLFTRKLPRILTQTIRTFRFVATGKQSTVFDIFEAGKFKFAISQILIFDIEKCRISTFGKFVFTISQIQIIHVDKYHADVRYSIVSSASELTSQGTVCQLQRPITTKDRIYS